MITLLLGMIVLTLGSGTAWAVGDGDQNNGPTSQPTQPTTEDPAAPPAGDGPAPEPTIETPNPPGQLAQAGTPPRVTARCASADQDQVLWRLYNPGTEVAEIRYSYAGSAGEQVRTADPDEQVFFVTPMITELNVVWFVDGEDQDLGKVPVGAQAACTFKVTVNVLWFSVDGKPASGPSNWPVSVKAGTGTYPIGTEFEVPDGGGFTVAADPPAPTGWRVLAGDLTIGTQTILRYADLQELAREQSQSVVRTYEVKIQAVTQQVNVTETPTPSPSASPSSSPSTPSSPVRVAKRIDTGEDGQGSLAAVLTVGLLLPMVGALIGWRAWRRHRRV